MRDFFFMVSGFRIHRQERGMRGRAGERLKESLQSLEFRVTEVTGLENPLCVGVAARGRIRKGRVVGEHLV
jgi:hypothetical protein